MIHIVPVCTHRSSSKVSFSFSFSFSFCKQSRLPAVFHHKQNRRTSQRTLHFLQPTLCRCEGVGQGLFLSGRVSRMILPVGWTTSVCRTDTVHQGRGGKPVLLGTSSSVPLGCWGLFVLCVCAFPFFPFPMLSDDTMMACIDFKQQ